MPLYEIECVKCKSTQEVIISLEDLPEPNSKNELNLKLLGIVCESCNECRFKKLISAHGKTPVNWASWQTQGGNSCSVTSRPSKRLRKK